MSHGHPGRSPAIGSDGASSEPARLQHFRVTETALEDGAAEIAVQGELDLAVADRLDDAIERAKGERILISLASCEFIDSTGIAVIVRASQADGRRVVVHSASAQVLRILEVTGLTGNGLVFEHRDEALSACA
jgi:anti-anti-sigma factor